MKENNKNMNTNINKNWNICGKITAGKYYIIPEGDENQYPVTITPLTEKEYEYKEPTTNKADEIEQEILNDGYIGNKNLYRRWIMAQMFRHYKESDGKTNGFDHYFVTGTKYRYAWETTKNEVKALRHLHGDELNKRERFFNMYVVKDMAKELEARLEKTHSEFLKEKLMPKLEGIYKAKNYFEMYKALKEFGNRFDVYNITMPKPSAWKNAFKGAGAYYTMDNLIKFHGCRWEDENGHLMSMKDSLIKLEKAVNRNRNSYYKLYAIMCNFIRYNHFDFDKRMKEIYDRKAV